MVEGVGSSSGTNTTGSATKPAANPGDSLASKETFLKLLVAQIRHQNPLAPADGIQFLSQLAQFSGLEQTIEMRRELEAIHKVLEGGPSGTTEGKTETDNSEETNGTGKA